MEKSRCILLELNEQQSARCAYHEDEPRKAISALEFLATTVVVAVFAKGVPAMEDSDGLVSITGQIDSQASAKVVSREVTTSFPLCCIEVELSARLEAARSQLDLDWPPREFD